MARLLLLCVFLAACAGGGAGGDDVGGDDQSGTLAVTLPQALEGAMLANPDVYTTIPVRVEVDGAPDTVTVSVDGESIYTLRNAKAGVFRDLAYRDYPRPSERARGGRLAG